MPLDEANPMPLNQKFRAERTLQTIVSVQYLRAIAALAIVVFHLKGRLTRLGFDGGWPDWLQSGVDLFFVISGFIMITTVMAKKKTGVEFFKERILRIAPIYWIWTTLIVITAGSSRPHAIASYLFIPWEHPADGEIVPVLIPGWTLNYEMFFYAIFALCLMVSKRHYAACCTIALVAISASGLFWQNKAFSFYSDAIILEFGIGMALGWVWATGHMKAHWSLLIWGALLLPILDQFDLHRLVAWGVPSAIILAGALASEKHIKSYGLPTLLGDASYSIYLVHGLALSLAFTVAFRLGVSWQTFIPIGMGCAIIAGILAYLFVEKPIARFLRKMRKPVTPSGDRSTSRPTP